MKQSEILIALEQGKTISRLMGSSKRLYKFLEILGKTYCIDMWEGGRDEQISSHFLIYLHDKYEIYTVEDAQ